MTYGRICTLTSPLFKARVFGTPFFSYKFLHTDIMPKPMSITTLVPLRNFISYRSVRVRVNEPVLID